METIQNPEPRLRQQPSCSLLSSVALCLYLSLSPFHPRETYSFKTPFHQLGDTEVSSVLPPPALCDSLNFFPPASPVARRTSTRPTLMRTSKINTHYGDTRRKRTKAAPRIASISLIIISSCSLWSNILRSSRSPPSLDATPNINNLTLKWKLLQRKIY